MEWSWVVEVGGRRYNSENCEDVSENLERSKSSGIIKGRHPLHKKNSKTDVNNNRGISGYCQWSIKYCQKYYSIN